MISKTVIACANMLHSMYCTKKHTYSWFDEKGVPALESSFCTYYIEPEKFPIEEAPTISKWCQIVEDLCSFYNCSPQKLLELLCDQTQIRQKMRQLDERYGKLMEIFNATGVKAPGLVKQGLEYYNV